MERWEYQRVAIGNTVQGPEEVAALDKMGRDGWELVSSITSNNDTTFHYFKRRLVDATAYRG